MPPSIAGRCGPARIEGPGPGRDPRPALRALYATTFGHLGIVLPFLPPWIRAQGFGPVAIGLLLSLPPLFKILAPWSWGPLADRTGLRGPLLAGAGLTAALALTSLTFVDGLVALAALVALYGLALAPLLPYLEATAMEQSDRRGFAYGPVRLWGSLAFVVSASGYGVLQGRLPADAGLWLAGGLLLAGAFIATAALPAPLAGDSALAARDSSGNPRLSRAGLVRFLAACAMMQASHGTYYTFYSIRLQDLGFPASAIGSLWALAVVCEILLLTRMDSVVDRLGGRLVLQLALLAAAGRWLLIGSTASATLLAFGQVLHAATYAAFHVAAIRVIHRHFGAVDPAKGQALYSGMTFGLGTFVGSLAAGWLTARVGLPAAFQISAALALAALPVLGRHGGRKGVGAHGQDPIDQTRLAR